MVLVNIVSGQMCLCIALSEVELLHLSLCVCIRLSMVHGAFLWECMPHHPQVYIPC